MSLKKKGKIWYYRHTIGSNETLISTHQTSRREAEKAADRIAAMFAREKQTRQIASRLVEMVKALARREIDTEDAKSLAARFERLAMDEAWEVVNDIFPAPALTAEDIWRKYQKTAPELKPSSAKTKEQRFGKFCAWADGRDMRTLQERDCRRFLASLGDISGQTTNNYISDLSSVWKLSPELVNPWGEHLRVKANTQHKQAFSRDQVKRLLTYCQEHGQHFWHTAVTLAYYTGLRLKDVVYFSRSNITPDGYIDLIPAKTARTGRAVRIPINPQLQIELEPWLQNGKSLNLFPEMVKKYEQDRSKVTNEFQNILKEEKLYAPGFGFHSLRHTFVTEALSAGIDTKQVQAVVGHTAVQLTEGTYYHGERHADLSAYPEI